MRRDGQYPRPRPLLRTLFRTAYPESWYGMTSLEDLLGVVPEKVNDDRLYRALDDLLPHKDTLFTHFQKVYGELFGTTFEILLYDITSTYFEGQGQGNPQARRGTPATAART